MADVVNDDVWDIGNIAFEPERGNTIDFCNPYVLIDANFLVKNESSLLTNHDIDKQENTKGSASYAVLRSNWLSSPEALCW